jgi:hypothetical protein
MAAGHLYRPNRGRPDLTLVPGRQFVDKLCELSRIFFELAA